MRLDSKNGSTGESMKDRIFLNNLRLKCRIGASEKERGEPQEVLVDLSLFLDLRRAGIADNIGRTIDYRKVTRQVERLVSEREFKLLEALAERIASLVLKPAGVARVVVRVRKTKYSSDPSIGVEIERSRRRG